MTFSWNGRQLSGYTQGNVTYTYTYDTDGMRTSRTEHRLNGTEIVTNYLYNGSLLVSEETNGNITAYIYDPSGLPIGFRYHKSSYAAGVWDCYYYVKNVQGDIVEIYNDNGTRVVWYSYDEYGKPSAISSRDGYDAVMNNHLMYRGYYYEFKSHNNTGFQGSLGLYYLGSRYYDANIGRFISPDDVSYLGANGDFNAYNLYAYCSNNPVLFMDYTGYSPVNSISAFINTDGSLSLYDNNRFGNPKPFHEQILVVNGINPKEKAVLRSLSFDLYTGGWEFEYVDISLFDFVHAEIGIDFNDECIGFSAFASLWSPSVSFELWGIEVELSLEVIAAGAQFNLKKNGFSGKFSSGWGLGINIKW